MNVLVCGGRKYPNRGMVFERLSFIAGEMDTLITGDATGADLFAREWFEHIRHQRGAPSIRLWVFDADWQKHGKAAGPIRNQRMLDEGKPDLVIAFPGGRGTADMIRRAEKAGVRVDYVPE